ncbi:hypothetical protein KRR40_11320 [Niabella defluvii]|nr:hypothetical protein KRR40_11320 [Niabella sp. I65]
MSFKTTPANIVIFGGFGDLAWRKLIPAFYNLYVSGYLPDKFAIYGVHYQGLPEGAYEKHMLEGVNLFFQEGVKPGQQNGKSLQTIYTSSREILR